MKNICIAGVSGLLGQAYLRKARSLGWSTLGLSRSPFPMDNHIEVDVTNNYEGCLNLIRAFKPELIVNCIALVDLKRCEDDIKMAESVNSIFPGRLARLALENSASFIHISTDHLYNGSNAPYREDDPVSPMNQYAVTKLKGEQRVNSILPESLVIRTNIVGKRGDEKRPSFAEWLVKVLRNKENVTLFSDYITSSTHVDDVVSVSLDLLQKNGSGVFNVATRDYASKFEFGMRLANKIGFSTIGVSQGLMRNDKQTPARPANLSLDCSKVEKFLGKQMPSQVDTIEKLSREFGS